MVKTNTSILSAVLALAQLAEVLAVPREVGVLVEHFELGEREASALLLADDDPVVLRAAMERSGAALCDLAYLLAREGEKCRARSVIEYLYPSDWDPAQVLAEITADVPVEIDLKVPASPYAYESRELGNTLDISDLSDIPELSEAAFVSEVSRLFAERSFDPEELGIVAPEFEAAKLSGGLDLIHSRPILLGVFTPRDTGRRDRRVFAFATPYVRNFVAGEDAEPKGSGGVDPFADRGRAADADLLGVSIGVEFIEVAQSQVAGLLEGIPHQLGDSSQVREKAERLMAAGGARLFASAALKTTVGQRAKLEPVQEFSYPTEYDPAELVPELTAEILASGADLKKPAAPTAFDVRNVGMTIEVETDLTEVGGIEMIDLSIAPELVDLARQIYWGKDEAQSRHPIFRALSCESHLHLMPGDEALVAIFTPRKAADGSPDGERRILMFAWVELAGAGGP